MARIGIDATAISPAGKGVSRYQKNIVQALSQLASNHEYFVFLNQAFSIFKPWTENNRWHFIPVRIWKAIFWEQIDVPRWVNRLHLDIFHTTADRLPYIGGSRFLLTLFEVPDKRIRLARQARTGYTLYDWLSDFSISVFLPHSLKRASRVLVSSKNTELELIGRYSVDPEKIRSVSLSHEAIFKPSPDSQSRSALCEKLGIPSGYILHFSTQDPRENTVTVLKAFRQMKDKLKGNGDIKLLIVGSTGAELKKLIDQNHRQGDVICRGYVDEAELVEIYQGALLYVDPSFYEGFALQVLEAMASGVPILTSNNTSASEIVGEAGILLDPEDVEKWTEGMIRVLTHEDLRSQMRQKGLARAEAFNWSKTARETLCAYEEILNGKP